MQSPSIIPGQSDPDLGRLAELLRELIAAGRRMVASTDEAAVAFRRLARAVELVRRDTILAVS